MSVRSAVRQQVDQVRAVRRAVRRATLLPFLVRVAVFLTVLAGFVVAYPFDVWSGDALPALLVMAALPAFAPRRFWPTLAALVTVAGWGYGTFDRGEPIPLWRLALLAVLLYLGHTLCALAAVLPYDAVVDPAVVVRWLTRTTGVLAAAGALGVLLLTLAGSGGERGILAVTIGGLTVAVLMTVLLAWLVKRR